MRGELVTVALQGDFGKPRPVLIVQFDIFIDLSSVTFIPLTSDIRDTPLLRFTLEPTKENGLTKRSQVMIDKIQTISRKKISKPFGKISNTELLEVERLLTVFLGIA